ncbi:MAG: hypothetical protein Q8M34_01245 [Thermodesulfovibrionales bacterium]|nr:hypothetical protein [Thermodesulfovibrionales bacterium]
MTGIIEEIQKLADSVSADIKEKKGVFTLTKTVAERRSFLSKKKLVYTAKISIDENKKEIAFSEFLKESGIGISAGGDDLSPGFGFKKETYSTDTQKRSGTIEEQSNLFGKKYDYAFDFSKTRDAVEGIASRSGYAINYKLF